MDAQGLNPKINLKDDAGIRLKENVTYGKDYIAALREWMLELEEENYQKTLERVHFEDDLIKSDDIKLEWEKNLQLGLDFIVESIAPREDMEFDSGSIRYVVMDPDDQIPKRARNEDLRRWKCEKFVNGLSLSQADLNFVSRLGNWTENSSWDLNLQVFRIPEPPYAEFFRNKPEDIYISHLRALRERGYFENQEADVEIAAYLISKGHRTPYQIMTFFPHVITWERFVSAQTKVHNHIRDTLPDRLIRLEKVRAALTEKQIEAFDLMNDVDLAPTQEEACISLDLYRSSLTARLNKVKRQVKTEFKEFWSIKRHPKSWSEECDIEESGFFRKSSSLLENCPLIVNGKKVKVTESKHENKDIHTYDERVRIRSELNRERFSPALKAVLESSNRGGYKVRPGEYFHHEKELRFLGIWKKIYYLRDFSDEESGVFAGAIIKCEDEGFSLFAIRHRLKMVRKRRGENGQPFGRFARVEKERILARLPPENEEADQTIVKRESSKPLEPPAGAPFAEAGLI